MKVTVRTAVRFGDSECWYPVAQTGPARILKPDSHGYGRFARGGVMVYAHRHFREVVAGAVPADKELDHLCRNRGCCAPACVEPVAHAVNVQRGDSAKGSHYGSKTHCKRGHAFDEKNTYRSVGRVGVERRCRRCHAIYQTARKKAERAKARWERAVLLPPLPREGEEDC